MVDDRLAEVAELADALDSESSARNGRGGSNPLFGTRCLTGVTINHPLGWFCHLAGFDWF